MSRTHEIERPVTRRYVAMLGALISELGRDRIAELADVDPATVWRNLKGNKLTYSTAMKLRDAIRVARSEDGKPGVVPPPPFIGIENDEHYEICDIARQLLESDPASFDALLQMARNAKVAAESAPAKRERVLSSKIDMLRNPK